MNTRTNPIPEMHPPSPPYGSRALSTLYGGGIVLLPTANLWQMVAHVQQPQAITKLLASCPPSRVNRPELIFSDLETLRQWCPQLHPKLETLLAYHRRPLTLHVPAGRNIPLRLHDQRGEVAVRIAFDSFCYRLCEDLESPLVACLAIGPDDTELPTRFGRVRSDVLRAADYTVQRRQQEELGTHTSVRVRLDEGEELEFLR